MSALRPGSAPASPLLSSPEVAEFVARGFLRLDGLVPDELNRACLEELLADEAAEHGGSPSPLDAGNRVGGPIGECFDGAPAIRRMLALPALRGTLESLLGPEPRYDHHAVHVRHPGEPSQRLHADAIIDTRLHFDVQLMYFPHDVPEDMGGTLLVPGSHLRSVNEHDIARYQNLRGQVSYFGPAGSVLLLHHGIWHCGRRNLRPSPRYMFKLRLNPATDQVRRWDAADLADPAVRERVLAVLRAKEPWYEASTGRLELVGRAVLWRYLSGEQDFDLDRWLGRLENRAAPPLLGALPGAHEERS
ncbi:MAG TPA: phytanoyl-CoA dioxygenase family protein [Acidimicrobiales bacterium]|nr:phytanoyl-CoA dioxygenase family protein [Acidimicrobiales bacterium]